ncbi:bifunctional diaminohydroxyphosphoribosylaminopyrimidine deaminase/5-amino-6-(5-phosphoribosylamino)uracil reductase RibD [Lentibacillus lipolyticus]|nr:bifunctional diaminohydroxyphosphoribosylaminopyrimidine deaminase/5-amino-6-(5-phosphoribosylamino)uracil reductase RibD [Lentibacillus lipolyticus]
MMNDEYFMERALDLARSVAGQTNPNPPVGAIVVKEGAIVGMGAHLKAGRAHAEVHALQMAGNKANGADIYVTLEPCSHHGKTPPCADLIVEKGIRRAVIAVKDPNGKVAGRGVEKLRAAGVEVKLGVLEKEAADVNRTFFHYIQTGMPYVTLKTAASLDGKTATRTGDSKWITGEAARMDVHRYRHNHDAILVGMNTVLADNPSLTARLPNGAKNPLRIVLDSKLRTPLEANVVSDGQADTWIITGEQVADAAALPYEERGVTVIRLPDTDPDTILRYLGNQRIMSLFVEGGASVHGSFLKHGRMNQLVQYMAPKLIGGKNAPGVIAGDGFNSMNGVLSMRIRFMEMIGDDVKIIAEPREVNTNVYRNC